MVANKVARRLVRSPHREGGQAQFIDKPVGQAAHPWLSHLLHWSEARLNKHLTVEQLAHQVHVSKRTLSRHFVETTGMSPMDWLTMLRVRRARDLLETTGLPIEEVAEHGGFNSAALLRHHFRAKLNMNPRTYRERFHQIQ